MALVGEELASNAMLDKVLCVCSGRRPVKTCAEGLAYKGSSCGVVAAKSSMTSFGPYEALCNSWPINGPW